MSALTAKARRAAEWFKEHKQGKCFANQDLDGWGIYSRFTLGDGSQRYAMTDGPFSDRLLIAFCEDRGWQDQDQEADGVEWYATEEYAAFNECELAVILTGDGFRWKAIPVEESNRRMVSGTAPTRAEARAAAVEAARGMG